MNETRTHIFSSIGTIILACFLIIITGCGSTSDSSPARQLYGMARLNDSQRSFTSARLLYAQARLAFLAEGNPVMADQCRNAILRIAIYKQTYPYTEAQLRLLLEKEFPTVPATRIDGWFADGSSLEHMTIDGVTKYLSNPPIIDNIRYRNLDLFHAAGKDDKNAILSFLNNYINKPRPGPFAVYTNPKTFHAKGTLSVPRAELPATGTLRIWIPLPILTGPQQSVTIDSITPAAYLKVPPGGEDLGLAHMEVPLADLAGDLNISVLFTFTHYEQHFTIDPALVGDYDTADSEYIKYTRSYGNTTTTPEIRETARKVVGGESNPYLAAKKLYYYVIDNITYSLPPATLWPYGDPASIYVHTNRIGDCGCQSMYFAALCRSIGIPARTTGGKQMFNQMVTPGQYSDHFWGEFYLPNYGWIPVDTSIAQLEFYATDVSDAQRTAYRDYFFAHQDNLRLVFQKDVDIPVFPPLAGGILYIPGAIQNPDGTCDTMDENMITGELIQKYWTLAEDDVQSRIASVEKNLIAAVVNDGSTPAGMTLQDRMQHFQVPGLSIAVINHGKIEWAKGYGVTEAGGTQAVTTDTVFQACSVSKPVSVTGIMLLAQSGVIDISRNVNDYLTSWHLADNDLTQTDKATIQRLMSHTGGTNVSGFGGYPAGSAIPTLLQVLNGAPPANTDPVQVIYKPGSRYSYSGGGMEVLQQMAEDVTEVPFQSYMKSSLLSPLGMNSSDFVQPIAGPLATRAAKAHDLDGIMIPGGWRTYPELIAAGLWTTPSDLARVLIEIQKAATIDQGVLLTQQTATRILTQQPNSSMGLGFALTNGKGGLIFNHSGATFGYKSYMTAYRDRGQGIAIMTNGDNGYALFMEIIRSVAKVYGWPDNGVSTARLADVPLSIMQPYVGNYAAMLEGQALQIEIYLSGNALMIKNALMGTGSRSDLYPTSANTFLLRDETNVPGTITFLKDGSGNVTSLTIALQAGGTITATKK
jgi:CubicO group peptidase (beta-lactamase class C family)